MAMPATSDTPIKTQTRTIDGLSIRYAESGADCEVGALLVSPWPESLYCFEPMWDQLSEHARLLAVDLPGFGHSEGREDLFNSRGMASFILKLIDAFGLDRPHAIGPDIGTSALLFAAADQPSAFRSLVIGGGGAAVPLQLGVELKQIVDAPSLEALPSVPPRQAIGAVLNYHERHKLPDYVREDYLSGYDGDRFAPSLGFVRAYPAELPHPLRAHAADPHARRDHPGRPRPWGVARQRAVPAGPAPRQQGESARRRPFRMGRSR
jgi:pimeloyl-ACP methyl ester carboxylesterase